MDIEKKDVQIEDSPKIPQDFIESLPIKLVINEYSTLKLTDINDDSPEYHCSSIIKNILDIFSDIESCKPFLDKNILNTFSNTGQFLNKKNLHGVACSLARDDANLIYFHIYLYKESSESCKDSSIKESSESCKDSSIKESSESCKDSSIKESSESLHDSSIKKSSTIYLSFQRLYGDAFIYWKLVREVFNKMMNIYSNASSILFLEDKEKCISPNFSYKQSDISFKERDNSFKYELRDIEPILNMINCEYDDIATEGAKACVSISTNSSIKKFNKQISNTLINKILSNTNNECLYACIKALVNITDQSNIYEILTSLQNFITERRKISAEESSKFRNSSIDACIDFEIEKLLSSQSLAGSAGLAFRKQFKKSSQIEE